MIYRVIYKKFDFCDLQFHYKILLETSDKEIADRTAAEQRKVYKADQIDSAIYVKEHYPTTVY